MSRLCVCLSSVTFVRPTQRLKFSAIFLYSVIAWGLRLNHAIVLKLYHPCALHVLNFSLVFAHLFEESRLFWRIIIIIIIINDSIYPAVSKAPRTGNKVSCQPNVSRIVTLLHIAPYT